MAKISWGMSAKTLAETEVSEYVPYDGPTPPRGVYGFRIKRVKKSESTNGHNQMIVHLELDPRGKPEDKKYAGFFMMDYIIVKEGTEFKVKPFLDALGVSPADFTAKTMANEDGEIVKMGKTPIPGALVIGAIRKSKQNPDYFDISYLPAKEDDDGTEEDDADDDDSEDPF